MFISRDYPSNYRNSRISLRHDALHYIPYDTHTSWSGPNPKSTSPTSRSRAHSSMACIFLQVLRNGNCGIGTCACLSIPQDTGVVSTLHIKLCRIQSRQWSLRMSASIKHECCLVLTEVLSTMTREIRVSILRNKIAQMCFIPWNTW